jgi:hypothetical protein
MNIIKRDRNLCFAAIALCVITCLSSIGAPSGSVWLYCLVSLVSIVFAVIALVRTRGEREEHAKGIAFVQASWVFFSVGVAFEMLALAPFYRAGAVNVGISMASQGVLAILGLYILITTCRALKIPYAP